MEINNIHIMCLGSVQSMSFIFFSGPLKVQLVDQQLIFTAYPLAGQKQ